MSVAVFYVARLAPGDPLISYYGDRTEKMSPEEREWAMGKLGLNEPISVQYVKWVKNAFHGEVVAVFKKIHAPNGIALPVTFMLRFFPTVRSEFSDVFSSLRLRKLLSWKHPLDAMEYIVTPVIFRSSRIAEELAASAESRGISNPGKHTCRRKIEFQKRDWIMCVIAVCVTAFYFVLERMVA